MKVHSKVGSKERLLEMFQKVNKIKINESSMWGEEIKNENFDSPIEKDKKYLDKTVGDQSSQVSKYDDGTRYPVEDKLKVKDPSLEKLKGDDAPIKEAFEEKEISNDNSEESELDQMDTEETGVQDEEGTEEKPAWDGESTEEIEPEMEIPAEDGVEIELDGAEGTENEMMTNTIEEPHEDQIEGGLADNALPSEFCPIQLGKGVQIEMEHTDDPHKALEIVMDHLTEIPDYYDRLEKMEADAKGDSKEYNDGSVETDMGAPEDALLDPSEHWVDDYAPQNVSMGNEVGEEIPSDDINNEEPLVDVD